MCLYPNHVQVNGEYVAVPCGKCIDCKLEYSRVWSYRIALEASLYDHNSLITLTYNDDNRPKDGYLSKRDLQLFMKRLRKQLSPLKVRYFACGEYGSTKGRPHYHIILFNFDFPDKYYFFTDKKKSQMFRSPLLEKCWTLGYSSIGEVNLDSAKYVAKYLQKVPSKGFPKPFVTMSRRPGIGAYAFNNKWLQSDKIYLRGKYIKIPRYFLDRVPEENSDIVTAIKENRIKNALQMEASTDVVKVGERKMKKYEKIFGKNFDKYLYL